MTKTSGKPSEKKPEKGLFDHPLLLAVAPAILALIGTWSGYYLASNVAITTQIQISDHQSRQQAFGQLMGRKNLMAQLYVSRFEALIYSDYHEAKWRLAGTPKDSIDFGEASRWMHKSEEGVLEIAKSNQALFETLGNVRILFPHTPKLDELTNHLYRFKTPAIRGDAFKMTSEQLDAWKIKAVKDLQDLAETEYGKPVDELLDHLAIELHKES